jgi:ketosteroid isomerase-like protein
MTHDDVRRWIDAYLAAWRTYDPDAIGDLFSDDAEYRYYPATEPFRGRAAIVAAWTTPTGVASSRDEPGTWEATYEPFTVEGDRAVVAGRTRYWTDATRSTPKDEWANAYLLEFDPEGRCRRFTEYAVKRRDPQPPG